MATHYDVLGVKPSATPAQVRQAYHEQARRLHPDALAGRPGAELDAARRAMQDVNEAWRVLRDVRSRTAYDRSLREHVAPAGTRPAPSDDDDWLDRPYPRRPAEPGDLTLAIVRAVPWIAVLVVLGAIVVFTAYAGGGDDSTELVGRCITIDNAVAEQVPCTQPNNGRVVSVVDAEELCTSGTSARVVAGGDWYCLRPAEDGS